ncbi:T9SS type A sorting domain-containing protein [Rasiella sp. SM2506]|uniref:T9SS type A sorting domain-containing protein n=1 Tax=Rasiella sp. SM2506 TaxID=3423914 RepID=UPI003D7B7033
MRNTLLILLFVSITITCNSQWAQIGTTFLGDATSDEFGKTVAMNETGNIIAVGARLNDFAGFENGQVKVYQLQNNTWQQLGSDLLGETTGSFGEKFGWDIDLSATGTRLVVGAPFYVNGLIIPGATRVFEFNGTAWVQLGSTIEGENSQDLSGWSVSINNDGTRIIIGSSGNSDNGTGSGQARVYEYDGANWTQLGNDIEGETEYFAGGSDVAINGIGNMIAVGFAKNNSPSLGSGNGIVRMFELQGATWQQVGEDIVGEAELDGFGEAINLNTSGTRIAIGARLHNGIKPFSGQVKVFELNGANWTQLGTEILGEDFEALGVSVDLNSEGTILVAGGRANNPTDLQKGIVRIFRYINGNWEQVDNSIYGENNEDQAGMGVAMNSLGNLVVIGAPFSDANGDSSGQAKVFKNENILSVSGPSEAFSQFVVFPNPNKGIFNISFTEIQQRVTVNIVDLLGRQVVNIDYFKTNTIKVNGNLKTGVYLVEILANSVSETVRILIE